MAVFDFLSEPLQLLHVWQWWVCLVAQTCSKAILRKGFEIANSVGVWFGEFRSGNVPDFFRCRFCEKIASEPGMEPAQRPGTVRRSPHGVNVVSSWSTNPWNLSKYVAICRLRPYTFVNIHKHLWSFNITCVISIYIFTMVCVFCLPSKLISRLSELETIWKYIIEGTDTKNVSVKRCFEIKVSQFFASV